MSASNSLPDRNSPSDSLGGGSQHLTSKPIHQPRTKMKREGQVYRVYKLVGGIYKLKKTFYTAHQANRYLKGFGNDR